MAKQGKLCTAVVWSDLHCPWSESVAVNAIYKFTKAMKPEYDIHIGDNLDCAGISRFAVDDPKMQYEDPMIAGFQALGKHFNHLFKINPKGKKVWIIGNHENRLEAFVAKNPTWRGMLDDIPTLMKAFGKCPRADEIEIIYLRDMEDEFRVGHMSFCHGFSATKHVACKHVEDYDESVTFGHSHTMQMFTTTKRGVPRAGYCIGNLINKEGRRYMKGRAMRWVTGFAYMEYEVGGDFDGDYNLYLAPIVRGRFRYGGKIWDGN